MHAVAIFCVDENDRVISYSANAAEIGLPAKPDRGTHWEALFPGCDRHTLPPIGGGQHYLFCDGRDGHQSFRVVIHDTVSGDRHPRSRFILVHPWDSSQSEALLEFEKVHSLGIMAGQFAHEINNTLTSISGWLQLLAQETPVGHPHRESIEMLHAETRRSARAASQLLAMARGRDGTPHGPVDLNAALEAVLEMAAPTLKERRIEVNRQLADIPPVHGSQDQLMQVFLNLVLNAANAIADDEGRISVATGLDGDRVRVAISDTGVGIHPDHLDKIFEPFFSTRTDKGGTGLGLYVSRRIIRQHKGELWAESEWGRGSAFTVLLPRAAVAEQQ